MNWKHRALYVMRRRYYFQVLKAHEKLKQRWINNYCITRIGAPDVKEFLCHETYYVAQMSTMQDARKYKNYWYWCRKKSFEILMWLWGLDVESYGWKLHMYLKGFIVTPRPILSEVYRYDDKGESKIARQIFKQWRPIIDRSANEDEIFAVQGGTFQQETLHDKTERYL